ncbi:MAG: polysaccharide pyruvyl transferase family protein [Oscillospiraceae bacterium]|nr:polysaccharide pyruvyl transferase family protein [Oscillospiraceae bacterium]
MSYDYQRISLMRVDLMGTNIGDEIIFSYCYKYLKNLFSYCPLNFLPTQMRLDSWAKQVLNRSKLAFVCGTNLLASNMRTRKQWNVCLSDINLKTKFILCGVGWWQYQEKPNLYTRFLLSNILSKDYLHSVRDEYTRQKLLEIGIDNVVNTGCPSMWSLTEDFCSKIPTKKSSRVIFTVTDYKKDAETDRKMIDILLRNYDEAYVWLQSNSDLPYLKSMIDIGRVHIIPPVLEDYDQFLDEGGVDYVGTRLHGGIRALNHQVRSIIIGVDNRATEISNDTGLKVIQRNKINLLESEICSAWKTDIHIPSNNIAKWMNQFAG